MQDVKTSLRSSASWHFVACSRAVFSCFNSILVDKLNCSGTYECVFLNYRVKVDCHGEHIRLASFPRQLQAKRSREGLVLRNGVDV